jgi:peptide deformylase
MVREIMKDPIFLGRRSEAAGAEDLPIARDLLDTLRAHAEGCVGMAANMIGEAKRIIAFYEEESGSYQMMLNPEILRQDGRYEAEEGCLSLPGTRKAVRWRKIKVRWQNEAMQTRVKTFSGFTAQIIQHELDHCNGILI